MEAERKKRAAILESEGRVACVDNRIIRLDVGPWLYLIVRLRTRVFYEGETIVNNDSS